MRESYYRKDLAVGVGCFFLFIGSGVGVGVAGQSEATSWVALGLILGSFICVPLVYMVSRAYLRIRARP